MGVFGQMFACTARDEQFWGHHCRVPRAMSPPASQLCCLWGPFPGGSSEDLAGTEPQEHIQYTQGFGWAPLWSRHIILVNIKAVFGIIFYWPTPPACWRAAPCHTTGAVSLQREEKTKRGLEHCKPWAKLWFTLRREKGYNKRWINPSRLL